MKASSSDARRERWRGDEDRLDGAIAEFLRAEAAGVAGDLRKWLDRYPDCASGLVEFLEDRRQMDRLMMPVRQERASGNSVGSSDELSKVDTTEFVSTPAKLSPERYLPLKFHARGGMGEIWLAEDKHIGRSVAIKKLRQERQEQHARFLIEAQVTGQLEHPGVVPLHDLGVDEEGQPFYVMKFIQGRALAAAIADFHAKRGWGDWASDVRFRRLLETFISVCHAVAYAHSKGVLHRDIKPENVMLGQYGETLVVDWGLAKVMGQPEEPGHSAVRLSGGASSSATQDGAIVGSPYYISPEVAQQGAEALDRTSDVYLLGATLYEILTGKPPRQGSSQAELIDLARNSRPTPPRKIDRSIPPVLEAICLKAMAFRKEERYATPLALVDDIERFLAGEPTSAYREPLLARLGRWVRRHRRALLRAAGAASMVALAVWGLSSYRQARLLGERDAARSQLAQFNHLADEAEYFAANTDAVGERAPYYDPKRAAAIGQSALAIAEPWGPRAVRLPLAEERASVAQAEYGLLLRMAMISIWETHSADGAHEALALLERAKKMAPPSQAYYRLRGQCFTLVGDAESAAEAEKTAGQPDTPIMAEDHFLEGERLRLKDVGAAAEKLAEETPQSREYLARAIDEFREALALDPRHFWARFQLGRCLLALGHGDEGVESLGGCVAIQPASAWAYTERGQASLQFGHYAAAKADLNRALKLDPNFLPARLNLGIAHWLEGDREGAIGDFDVVMAAPADKRLVEAAYYRGQIRLEKDQVREALADFSSVIKARGDFRPAYWFRALAEFRMGSYDAGQTDLAKFAVLGQHAAHDESRGKLHLLLGRVLKRAAAELDGKAQAEALVRAVDEIRAAIASNGPSVEAYEQLGRAFDLAGRTRDAIAAYSEGIKLGGDKVAVLVLRGWDYASRDEQQFELARSSFTAALTLAPEDVEAHTGLGYALARLGHEEDALREASAASLSGSHEFLVFHNVACIHGLLSKSAGAKIEEEDLALAALRRAMELSPMRNGRREEVSWINTETAAPPSDSVFPQSLQSRPEFERLRKGQTADDR